MSKITIGWMYPDLLNLHGERGSVQALVQVAKQLGIDIQIQRIEDFDDPIPFDTLDLLMFLPGEITTFSYLIPALEKQRKELDSYIEAGGHILALGTSGLMFGNTIKRDDSTAMQGLGYLDLIATERKYVWGDDLHVCLEWQDIELVGSQIMMADVMTDQPLGTVVYGRGNNGDRSEGSRYKNLLYTNCLGPIFVKNPWFAEAILRDICKKKKIPVTGEADHTIAQNSFRSTLAFISKKA